MLGDAIQDAVHRTVRDTARSFAQQVIAPRARELDESGEFPRDIVRKAAELGLVAPTISPDYGGSGMDRLAQVLILEELVRVDAGIGLAIAASPFGYELVERFGSEAQKQRFLPALAGGELISGTAVTEPDAGSDVASVKTKAERTPTGWRLTGTKTFITNGNVAQVLFVLARTGEAPGANGLSVFAVETNRPGFGARKLHKMGIHASDLAEITLAGLEVPEDALIGKPGRGFQQIMSLFDNGRVNVAAQALGLAQGALDLAVAHAKERKQFGKRLAEMQAIRFKIADMTATVEAARALLYDAAVKVEAGGPEARQAASMAKLFCSDVAERVVSEAVGIHGGYGYIREQPIERFFRDVKITRIYEGTTEIQKTIIGRTLVEREGAGEARPVPIRATAELAAIDRFAREKLRPALVAEDREHAHHRELIRTMGELGLVYPTVPEDEGGSGIDAETAVDIYETLCRWGGGLGLSITSSALGCEMLLGYGSKEQKEKYLLPVLAGEMVSAICISEPDHGSDAGAMETRATRTATGYRLNGSKLWISNGTMCDFYVVLAKTDPAAGKKGISAFLVEAGTPGITARGLPMSCLPLHDTAEVFFEDVDVPASALLGVEGRGFYQVMEWVTEARVWLAAKAVGVAQGALDLATAYVCERKQFGQQLVDFQAVQFALAEMATSIEAARRLTRHAASELEAGRPATAIAAAAKLTASRTAMDVVIRARHLFGGAGLHRESPIHTYARDAAILPIVEGTSEIQQEVIARQVLGC